MENIDIPWVEKYRPRTLDEIVSHERSIARIKEITSSGSMPHLIFEGPPGTGKTSTALAMVHDMFKGLPRNIINESVKELNASDARGINVVRTVIKDFIKSKKNPRIPFKVLILDESDNMTAAAQQALRRQMEKFSKNCRLILICNYSNKIIPPIQSRCAVVHFKPLSDSSIINQIKFIAEKEKVKISEAGVEVLAYISYGDLRSSINTLQAAAMLSLTENYEIQEDDIYGITGIVDKRDIELLIEKALGGELDTALELVEEMIKFGSSGKEIALQVFNTAKLSDMSDDDKIIISALTSDTIYRISRGCTEVIQLRALVAGMFKKVMEL